MVLSFRLVDSISVILSYKMIRGIVLSAIKNFVKEENDELFHIGHLYKSLVFGQCTLYNFSVVLMTSNCEININIT